MSRVVWKFDLVMEHAFTLEMPAGAKILHLADQHDWPRIWATVDPTAALERRSFVLVGTGNGEVPADAHHIGTFLSQRDHFVWHVFEVPA